MRNPARWGKSGKVGNSVRVDLFFMPLLPKIITAKIFTLNKPGDFRLYIKFIFTKMFPLSLQPSQCSDDDDGTFTDVMDSKVGW